MNINIPISLREIGILLVLTSWLVPPIIAIDLYLAHEIKTFWMPLIFWIFPAAFFPLYWSELHMSTGITWRFKDSE